MLENYKEYLCIPSPLFSPINKVDKDTKDEVNQIINITSINELPSHLEKNLVKVLNIWIGSQTMKNIFNRNNIDINNFRNLFASKIIEYFIESVKWWKVWECPYLKEFIKYLHTSHLWIDEINCICMELRYSIREVSKNVIDKAYIHEIYLEIDKIMTKNINWVLFEYEKELSELKKDMWTQLELLRITLNKLHDKNENLEETKNELEKTIIELEETKNELEKTIIELDQLSNTDQLTWISNRRKFDEILEKELNRSKRNNQNFSLLLIDIDYFKNFNDTFWHTKWDNILKIITDTINPIIRKSDTFARFWWEEFVIILPETSIVWWKKLAKKIKSSVESIKLWHEFSVEWEIYSVTVSQWVSQNNPNKKDETANDIINKADSALYEAKNSWRNQVCINSNE